MCVREREFFVLYCFVLFCRLDLFSLLLLSGLAQEKIDEVKNVMVKNIETIMQNEEKIEILVEKSEQLDNNAFKFQRAAKKVHY